MDKRWVGIIIILILGIGAMYLIVDSSPTVGKAVAVASEMTITIPDGFTLLKDTEQTIKLINKQNETINITIIGLGDNASKEFKATLNALEKSDDIEVQDKNATGNMIFYKNLTANKECSVTYFVKENRTIELQMTKYKNWENDWKFVVDTIQHNFKQNK